MNTKNKTQNRKSLSSSRVRQRTLETNKRLTEPEKELFKMKIHSKPFEQFAEAINSQFEYNIYGED